MRLKLQHLAICIMALIPMLSWAQSENEEQKEIQITFAASGDAETVESILVENLTQEGEQIELNGSDILVLNAKGTGIENASTSFGSSEPLLYPNPAEGDGNLVFDVKQDGNVTVSIFSMNGVLMERAVVPVFEGRNALTIPSQGYGFFMVYVEGNGIHYAEKWMCGAPNSGNGIRHNGTNAVELPKEEIMQTRAQAPERKGLKFNAGDVLRYTAKSGEMTNIVIRKPEMSHTLTFQFYKCQDADGYNYTTIEAAGMLWMAENLRYVKNSGVELISDAKTWKEKGKKSAAAYENFDENSYNGFVYYTQPAAQKALPEGWKLPTMDALLTVAKFYGGEIEAGAFLKSKGETWINGDYSIDEVGLGIDGSGKLTVDGNFKGIGTEGYLITRGAKGKSPMRHAMLLDSKNDRADMSYESNIQEGYVIRGVHASQSAYNGFISEYQSSTKKNVMPMLYEGNGLEGNPFAYTAPLGQHYQETMGEVEYISDLSLKKMNSYEAGKTLNLNKDITHKLHRFIGQNMADGYQRVVYAEWSKESQKGNGQEGNEDTSLCGPGKVHLEIFPHLQELEKDSSVLVALKSVDLDVDFNLSLPENASNKDYTANIDNQMKFLEHYMSSFQVECADFNGDHIDDIVIAVSGTIAIIDGQDYTTVLAKRSFPQIMNGLYKLRFTTGDLNKDGKSDLAVIYSKMGVIMMDIFMDGYENFSDDQDPTIVRSLGNADNFGILITNINDDKDMDIVAYIYSEIDKEITLRILSYNYDNKSIADVKSKTFNQTNTPGLSFTNSSSSMVLLRGRDITNYPEILVNGCIFRWDNKDLNFLQSLTDEKGGNINILSGNVHAARFVKTGEMASEQLLILAPSIEKSQGSAQMVYTEYLFTCTNKRDTKQPDKFSLTKKESFKDKLADVVGNELHNMQYVFRSTSDVRSTAGLRELELTSILTTMSEPRIYAVLAAPPYWAEYKDQYVNAPETSWGYSSSSGQGESRRSTNSASLIMGFEHDFSAPFVGTIAGIDFETELTSEWESSGGTSTQESYGVDYSTHFKDAVVMQLTGFTSYVYTVVQSYNEDETGSEMIIGIPDRPRNMSVTIDDYMRLRADNPNIPNLKNLLKHEVGNPFSYKDELIDKMPSYGKVYWGKNDRYSCETVGSGTSASRSIEITEESEQSNANTFNLDTKLVGNVLGVKAGAGYGHSETWETSHTEAVGHSVNCTIVAPNILGEIRAFDWNLCRMNVKFEGQQFPVVTYIVQE